MAKPKSSPRKTTKAASNDEATVLSVRIAPSKVAALDAWVVTLNADPTNPGRVTRNSLILHIIDNALAARSKTSA